MHLKLQDADGLFYDIRAEVGKTAMIGPDEKDIDLDNIQRSFQPGSIIIGKKRQSSGTLNINFDIHETTDAAMRATIGNLLYWANKAIYLIDADSDFRTKIALINHNIPWLAASEMRSTPGSLEFIQLTPYWEDVDYTEETGSGSSIVKAINNQGWLETPPLITLTASTTTLGFAIWITQNSEGIEIGDLSFGTNSNLLIYTIDCEAGVVTLADIERNDRIRGGSGFFNLPVGLSTLNIESDQSLSASIKYRRRFYL